MKRVAAVVSAAVAATIGMALLPSGCGKTQTPAAAPDSAGAQPVAAAQSSPAPLTPGGLASMPLTVAPATMPATQATTPKALAGTIKQAIALVQAGKIAETIELMDAPSDVAQMKAAGQFDQAVARFDQKMRGELITALQAAQNQTPVMTENGTVATFPHIVESLPELEFHLVEGGWRLED